MGHQNIEAEIYIGRWSSKEAYKVAKCLLLMLFIFLRKINQQSLIMRSNYPMHFKQLEGEKSSWQTFPHWNNKKTLSIMCVQLSKSILESRCQGRERKYT